MICCIRRVALVLAFACGCQFDQRGELIEGAIDAGGVDAPQVAIDAAPTADGIPPTDAPAMVDATPCVGPLCSFSRRRPISIDVTRITTELRDVPVLIALDSSRIDYGQTQNGGQDLRFYTFDLATELDYEIESWDEGGTSYVWLLMPQLAPAGTPLQLWMYHGDPAAPAGQDPPAVWVSSFVSVHHLSGNYLDSTAASRDGIAGDSPTSTDGPLGGAYRFDGENDYIELPDEGAYDFSEDMSASLWFHVDDFTREFQALLAKGDHAWRLHRDRNSDQIAFATTNGVGSNADHAGPKDVNDDEWHHVLISYDGARKYMYVDGVEEVNVFYGQNIRNSSDVVFIGENSDERGRYFFGSIDEVRIASQPRSADWALVEYLSVTDSTFIVVGAEEPL